MAPRPDADVLSSVLARLEAVIESRRGADPATSYVAKRLAGGTAKIAQKVGEEAVEAVIAATIRDRDGLIEESADLLFHLMIMWADGGVRIADVLAELERREGVSGLDAKKAREK
jgi:phosphoribosyl-ATP pyrophosphohydrolase